MAAGHPENENDSVVFEHQASLSSGGRIGSSDPILGVRLGRWPVFLRLSGESITPAFLSSLCGHMMTEPEHHIIRTLFPHFLPYLSSILLRPTHTHLPTPSLVSLNLTIISKCHCSPMGSCPFCCPNSALMTLLSAILWVEATFSPHCSKYPRASKWSGHPACSPYFCENKKLVDKNSLFVPPQSNLHLTHVPCCPLTHNRSHRLSLTGPPPTCAPESLSSFSWKCQVHSASLLTGLSFS